MGDEAWYRGTLVPPVARRGATVIEARGASSATASSAALDHMRDWMLGSNGRWVSMALRKNEAWEASFPGLSGPAAREGAPGPELRIATLRKGPTPSARRSPSSPSADRWGRRELSLLHPFE